MDLTGWLLRVAARRPHALVVAVPGATGVRLAVEAELGLRGWPVADSPAGADLLVIAGTPGAALAAVVETVWTQLPAPRARATVAHESDLVRAFDAGVRDLADAALQRRGPDLPEPEPAEVPVAVEHAVHDAHNTAAAPESGHDMPAGSAIPMDPAMSMDQDTPAGHDMRHDHGGMEGMEMPGGVPMADLGADRDGLMLDALHVELGPVLPDWPAGTVLRAVVQGDVIREAEVEVLDLGEAGSSFWSEPGRRAAAGEPVTVGDIGRRAAAGHLDALARFLGVAGWSEQATRARRLRDAVLAGKPGAGIIGPVGDLAAGVGRSRTLRWLVRGIPAGEHDVPARLAARLSALRAALDLLDDPRPAAAVELGHLVLDGGAMAPADLAAALVGLEVAAARLVITVVDPDPSARRVAPHEHR